MEPKTVTTKFERLIAAAHYMMDTLDHTPFRDSANMRLHEQHPAYEKLQRALDEATS